MEGGARRHQTPTQNSESSSAFSTAAMGSGSDIIAPHETNTQASPALLDVLARLECKLNEFQSATQTPMARAAALATVDQDIDTAKRLIPSMLTHHNTLAPNSILSILMRRNMLAPISILPAEILTYVFHFTAFSERPYSHTLKLGWVYVTHVCRRWRQVALDNSTLWTHFSISPRNQDWIAERLSRAGNAPLVLELDGSISKDTFSLFTPHISHTRELDLRNLQSEIVQGFSIERAPALEVLELSVSKISPIGIEHLVGHSFFNGQLPKLRIFRVSQIVFPWSLVPRGQLTQLKVTLNEEALSFKSEVSLHADDLNQLIDLLVSCPSLEVLTLDNCLPAMLSEYSGGQTIHFPLLSSLCLGGSSSRVTNLLKLLKLSSSTTLRLDCTSENTATHNDHDIFPILSAHFNDPTSVKFRSFKINLDHVGRVINIVASTSLPISPFPHTHAIQADSDGELGLSFYSIAEPHDKVVILRRACEVLSLSNIEFLSVSMDRPSPDQFINWGEIFQHCTEVSTIQVYGRGTIGLLQALKPPKRTEVMARVKEKGRMRKRGDDGSRAQAEASNNDDKHAPAPAHELIFPKLTSLLLGTQNFKDAVPGSGVLYNLVLGAIQRRKANKMPLTTLCIDKCSITKKQAKALEKVVRDFRWDHDEGNDEDTDDSDYDYTYTYDHTYTYDYTYTYNYAHDYTYTYDYTYDHTYDYISDDEWW